MKDNRIYAQHIIEAIDRIQEYTDGGREEFFDDAKTRDAVLWSLQTLAESTTRLSSEVKACHPETDWRAIAGFRNVVVHDYLGLDLEVLWRIVERDLPALQRTARAILDEICSRAGRGLG